MLERYAPLRTQSLVIDTYAPGELQKSLHALRARGDSQPDHLLHAWSTECGPLNRIVSLWEGEAILSSEQVERPLDW